MIDPDPPPPRRRHSDQLDDMLWEYLMHEREDPIRARLQHQADWMSRHDKEDLERFAQLREAVQGQNFRLSSLEAKAEKLEEHDENTGRHDLESLRAKAQAPQQFRNTVAASVVAGALLAVLAFIAARLIH